MAYQERPSESDIVETIASTCNLPSWLRCPRCGQRFGYVEYALTVSIVPYCIKCKVYFRFILGVNVEG